LEYEYWEEFACDKGGENHGLSGRDARLVSVEINCHSFTLYSTRISTVKYAKSRYVEKEGRRDYGDWS